MSTSLWLLELDKRSCRPHHSWNRKKNLVSTPPISPENAIPKAREHSIIYKSTTFAHFCYLYVNLLNFVSFLHKSQQSTFFQKKQQNSSKQKTKKITYLLTFNKYLDLLPWVDCEIVKLSPKKKKFQYQDVFYIKR